jgi:hypothetical protein
MKERKISNDKKKDTISNDRRKIQLVAIKTENKSNFTYFIKLINKSILEKFKKSR